MLRDSASLGGMLAERAQGAEHCPQHHRKWDVSPCLYSQHGEVKYKNQKLRAGEMAQQVRALTVLPKVLSSNPSNHMVAHNHPQ